MIFEFKDIRDSLKELGLMELYNLECALFEEINRRKVEIENLRNQKVKWKKDNLYVLFGK